VLARLKAGLWEGSSRPIQAAGPDSSKMRSSAEGTRVPTVNAPDQSILDTAALGQAD